MIRASYASKVAVHILRFCLLFLFAVSIAAAGAAGGQATTGSSGLPLPRFVSTAGEKVNLRTGPGVRYPVAWVFVRKGLPVMVTLEFENWRKVRDLDGAEGWVHHSLLSGRRYAVVTGTVRSLRREPRPEAAAVLRAEPGVIGRLRACSNGWCQLEIAEIEGWLPREQIFGVLPDEDFD